MSKHIIPETDEQEVKKYNEKDLLKLQCKNAYSSIGEMILSLKPSAPRATFGKADRAQQKKVLQPSKLSARENWGRETKGPAAYLPPRQTIENGQIIEGSNPTDRLKYNSVPSHSIGKAERKTPTDRYAYLDNKHDFLDVNGADLKRRKSVPTIRMSTEKRFGAERADKVIPGPTYDPVLKPEAPIAPKYTFGSRRAIKGQDPLMSTIATTPLVGPSSYFQGRAKSMTQLDRVPLSSRMPHPAAISFAKGPKAVIMHPAGVEDTYDIKHKTIMARYDFEYDGGKGLHSGRAWMKNKIITSAMQPVERNKMGSYTMAKCTREIENKRGFFHSIMTNAPASVRMVHPSF